MKPYLSLRQAAGRGRIGGGPGRMQSTHLLPGLLLGLLGSYQLGAGLAARQRASRESCERPSFLLLPPAARGMPLSCCSQGHCLAGHGDLVISAASAKPFLLNFQQENTPNSLVLFCLSELQTAELQNCDWQSLACHIPSLDGCNGTGRACEAIQNLKRLQNGMPMVA